MDTIPLGKHNPRVSQIRKATQRGILTEEGLLPVEGPHLIEEALRSGLQVRALFVRNGVRAPGGWSHIVYALDAATFKGIQATEHSQGVVALVRPRSWSLDDVVKPEISSPVVILDGLQDPGNVGTILRVAEAFGAAGCVGLRGTCSVHNSKVVRASAGSVFRLPHAWDVEWAAMLDVIRAAGIALVGTAPQARQAITSMNWRKPTALLVGNEGSGLPPEHLSACSATVRIPQQTPVESLNSAVATAVILYEAWRGRQAH